MSVAAVGRDIITNVIMSQELNGKIWLEQHRDSVIMMYRIRIYQSNLILDLLSYLKIRHIILYMYVHC